MSFLVSIFLCALSAGLYILSFPNFNLWFLAWIALVPFLFVIDNAGKFKTIFLSFLFGAATAAGLSYWLTYVVYVTPKTFILALIYVSVYLGAFGFLANRIFVSKLPLLLEAISVSAVWTTLEYLRTYFVVNIGGWGALGYSQSGNLAIIQIADIAGYSGVSFLIVMVNVLIKQAVGQKRGSQFIFSFVVTAILAASCLIYGFVRLNTDFVLINKAKISVIQGNVPQSHSRDLRYRSAILRKYEKLTRLAAKENPDLIVWPETSVPKSEGSAPDTEKFISNIAKRNRVHLLVGFPRRGGLVNDYFNSAVLFDPNGAMITYYDKQRLVPIAEIVPNRQKLRNTRKMLGINPDFDFENFRLGNEYVIFNLPAFRFGVLICFEDFFSVRNYIKNGVDLLVNITNDGWFEKSSEPFQHAQASVLRAVEYRIPVVRCANTGVSEFIDIYGRVYNRVSNPMGQALMVAGYKTDYVKTPGFKRIKNSFYSNHEYWFANVCVVFVLPLIILLIARHWRRSSA